MNGLELALVAVLLLWAVAGVVRLPASWQPTVGTVLATLAAFGTILLAVGPRWRWQLLPLAAAAGVVALVQLVRLPERTRDDLGGRSASGIVVAATVASVAVASALPVVSTPLPPGEGPVGTTAFDLVDESRRSLSTTAGPDAPRQITVQAWWPAADASGPRLALTDEPDAFAAAAGDFLGLPGVALRHLDTVRFGAHVGAPPADTGELPVIVSLHGRGSFRFAQAPLLEQLAADGHLVLAIDHTHGSLGAQPVAGGVVPFDPALLPGDDVSPADADEVSTRLEDTFRGDAATLVAALRDGAGVVPDPVLELADLDRIVVMGHSTGGGAAVWWCGEDPACDGVLTWDPWVEPLPDDVRASPTTVPWLSVLSAAWIGNDNDGVLRPMVSDAATAEVVAIEGTIHNDITAQPLLSPLAGVLGLAGDLDKQRVDEAALALSRAFLADVFDGAGGDDGLDELPPDVVRP